MVGDTILIKDISINGNNSVTGGLNTSTADKLSETLTGNTINALGIDASSRTMWINGQPYGNAYVNIKEDNTVEAPIGAEIFNDFEHNIASGDYSHAEGRETSATGNYSHASGFCTKTTNTAEAAFGQFNQSTEGSTIFSIGDGDSDSSRHNIVEVTDNEVNINNNLNVEDNLIVDGNTTIGGTLDVTGKTIVSELKSTGNADLNSLGVTSNTTIGGTLEVDGPVYLRKTVAAGNGTTASGNYSHAEGQSTTAFGTGSHAEGNNTKANGDYSHTTGSRNVAEGENSTLQGYYLFDHGIDTENSFIWLQCPGEIATAIVDDTGSPTREIPGMNQTPVVSYGCGYIRIGEQYLTNPEQPSTDKRKGHYAVTGSFFEKGPIVSEGWSLKMGINDSFKYYISVDDLVSIVTSWDDNGLFLTPEFKIYKYVSSSKNLDVVTTVQGCNWVRTDKYVQRIQEIINIYPITQNPNSGSINALFNSNTSNAQPTKFTNNNATIIGQYNKPKPDNIFEVGCGALPDDRFPIKQRNAISVSNTGKTIIADLNSDTIVANTIKVSKTDSSTSNTQLSATSIGVTDFKDSNTTIITKQISNLPNESSSGTLCKTIICCDGILIGYSQTNYVYLTIDKKTGNVSLKRKGPDTDNTEKTATLNWK